MPQYWTLICPSKSFFMPRGFVEIMRSSGKCKDLTMKGETSREMAMRENIRTLT